MLKLKIWVLALTLVVIAYVCSYVWMSRRGYAEADQIGMHGFYYFCPENTEAWRFKNQICEFLYLPLNSIDRSLGLGRYPATEPLWGLGE